ncbi:MAG: hypothetical protein FRX49_11975 [Trebouxia sp. A1-2]|nr:MAG: hypothetical protein FRX49_11975 [Trebouxia sp. A1-2]
MTLVGMVSFRLSSYTAAPSGPHGQSFAAKGSELAGLIRTVLVGLNTEVAFDQDNGRTCRFEVMSSGSCTDSGDDSGGQEEAQQAHKMMQEEKYELTAESYSPILNNIPPKSACSFGLSGNISTSMLAPSSASPSFASFNSWQISPMAAILCNTKRQ